MRLFLNTLSAVAVAAATITTAIAQDEATTDIVVTATRIPQSVDSIGSSVSLLDAKTLETRQTPSLIDLLRTVPGVSVARNGGVGTVSSVFIRGAESAQTVVLIDGVKLNDPSSPGGGYDFGTLLLNDIDRVEVVRGAQSVLWGSQAIGGVVNLISRTPTSDPRAAIHVEGGSFGTADFRGDASGAIGPVAASAGLGWYRTDGVSALARDAGGEEADGFNRFAANAAVRVTIAEPLSIDLRGWYSDSETEIDGFLSVPPFSGTDTAQFNSSKQWVGYAGANLVLLDGRFTNRLGYSRTKVERGNFDPEGATVETFTGDGENERLDYQGGFDFGGGIRADFGLEREVSRYATSSFGGPEARARARLDSGFVQLGASPVDGLNLSVGARHDNHDRFGGNTSLAANLAYTPNGGATLVRASYGEGFKVPSLFQLLDPTFGNARLRPETAAGWDAGVTQKLADDRIILSATWFQRTTRDQIGYIGCPRINPTGICIERPSGTYDNVERSRARGVEATATFSPSTRASIQGGYSYIDANDQTSGLRLLRRPVHSGFIVGDISLESGLALGTTLTFTGQSDDVDFDAFPSRRVKLDSYILVDVRASLPVGDQVSVFARAENLFDEQYESVLRAGTLGRGVYAGVKVGF